MFHRYNNQLLGVPFCFYVLRENVYKLTILCPDNAFSGALFKLVNAKEGVGGISVYILF